MDASPTERPPVARKLHARRLSVSAIRLAPWVVFGPITGCMTEAAYQAFKGGRPLLAAAYILLNISVLLGMPLATALLMAHR